MNWLTTINELGDSFTPQQAMGFFQGVMLLGLVFSLVFGVIYYIITRLMLKKKLNLE